MTATTIQQTEDAPDEYPDPPAGLSAAAAALDPAMVWQRIEAYTVWRFSEREVVWVVEGCGEWLPPLHVAVIDTRLAGTGGFDVFRLARKDPDLALLRVILVGDAAEGGALRLARDVGAYAALVRGAFPERLDADAPIAREDPAGGSSRRRVDPSGKPSRTEFRRVAVREDGRCSAVLAVPRSGRTNQIRVHASHAGFPILGDKIYGDQGPLVRHLLHCLSLEIRHPATGDALRLHAPLPPEFERAWGGPLPAFGVSLPGIDCTPTGSFPGLPFEGRAP